jgi:hypothetical protein
VPAYHIDIACFVADVERKWIDNFLSRVEVVGAGLRVGFRAQLVQQRFFRAGIALSEDDLARREIDEVESTAQMLVFRGSDPSWRS